MNSHETVETPRSRDATYSLSELYIAGSSPIGVIFSPATNEYAATPCVSRVGGSEASPAFPSGLYGKFKQATNYFLDWLLRARTVGVGADASVATKSQLKTGVAVAAYEKIVATIAREPRTLPPSLIQHWERALAACETAITLRARVSLFFPATSETAIDTHTYFLARLRSWLKSLKHAKTTVRSTASTSTKSDEKPLDFSNYYAVLELPDDYFQASSTEIKVTDGPASKKAPAVDPAKLFDEAFENDLNMELSFLFMELEELLEALYDGFLDVKQHKKTLVEAAAVAKAAVDCAESVIAKLQLRFPSIRTAEHLITTITDRIPEGQLGKLMRTVTSMWTPSMWTPQKPSSQIPPRSSFVAGTIVVDILWVSAALGSFVSRPFTPNTNVHMPEEATGETYSEERTPHYCTPNFTAAPSFWMQQLSLLYNKLSMNRTLGIKQDAATLSGWFLTQADEYFTKRSVSIHFVFVMICWVRSVSALQGEGGLGRTVHAPLGSGSTPEYQHRTWRSPSCMS